MHKKSRILIVGHNDLIENSLTQHLKSQGFKNVFSSSRIPWDTLNQRKVRVFFARYKPDYVFLGSVRSGGIAANQKFAAEFIYENLESQNIIIHAACQFGVKKLLYFTGSCTYPKEASQPMKEEYLLTGPLEPTSEPYSIAKIAGTRLCQAYRRQYGFNAIVGCQATIYGPGADTDLDTSHVLGALIGKFYKAVGEDRKEVVVWGSGRPRREFLYADDFVRACLFLMDHYADDWMINVGCGYDISIKELAELIKKISGFTGKIIFDKSRPDGTFQKLLDIRRITHLGWKPKVGLKEGLKKTYQWYEKSQERESRQ